MEITNALGFGSRLETFTAALFYPKRNVFSHSPLLASLFSLDQDPPPIPIMVATPSIFHDERTGMSYLGRLSPFDCLIHDTTTRTWPEVFADFQAKKIEFTGVMVHRCIPEVDRGTVIVKEVCPIKETDKLGDLEERIHEIEHRLIVQGVDLALMLMDCEQVTS